MSDRILVNVDGRALELSNLDKVLYPACGFTKGEVIDYYTRIAPTILPHLADRALTRIRYPNGVTASGFFEKNAPAGTPSWVHVERLPAPGSSTGRAELDYVVVELRFGERTRDGRLRFPRFLQLRPDKTPDEVIDE